MDGMILDFKNFRRKSPREMQERESATSRRWFIQKLVLLEKAREQHIGDSDGEEAFEVDIGCIVD